MLADPLEAVQILQPETGRARSARNATKHGLFAARDFIRPGEEDEYAQTLAALTADHGVVVC